MLCWSIWKTGFAHDPKATIERFIPNFHRRRRKLTVEEQSMGWRAAAAASGGKVVT